MAYFADDPAIRGDMNAVRLNLARRNPNGYACPLQIQFTPDFCIRADVLPLYYCSSVVRDQLEKIPERPSKAILCVKGSTDVDAFKIVLAYSHGSSNAHNWVADLAARPELAAYVWELAIVYKIEKLELYTRDPAFDAGSGSLNIDTAVRLFKHSSHIPQYRDKALKYMCYNFARIVGPPEQSYNSYLGIGSVQGSVNDGEIACRDFGFLTYLEVREIITSIHVRATETQRFNAVRVWATSVLPRNDPCVDEAAAKKDEKDTPKDDGCCKKVDPWVDEPDPCVQIEAPKQSASEKAKVDRGEKYFRLAGLIYYPLISNPSGEIKEVAEWREMETFGLLPRKANERRRIGSMRFYAFKLDDLLSEVNSGQDFYEPPRLRGLFKAYNYYWQVEVPWYQTLKVPSMGILLRVLHGTDEAGSTIKKRELAGLMAKFMFRLHCSDNFDKCYRQTDVVHVDMLNLPAGHKAYGFRSFLGKRSCKFISKLKNCVYVSVQLCGVKEIAKST
jgi:hypothetical protein